GGPSRGSYSSPIWIWKSSLLDRSAAFNTVGHNILLQLLLNGESYVSGRSQTVSFKNDLSETCAVGHGVPQGSVLGPLQFSLCLLPLCVLLRSFNVTFHCCTDDLQLFVPLTIGNWAEVSKLESCLFAIRGWLSDNFLLLNTDKTELMTMFFTYNIAFSESRNSLLSPLKDIQSLSGNIIPYRTS
uniref:Reverse transcriptase domain-containing protein n=1 Tax=Oreochromis aureus TaxID=47969 RepID=A0AAZ1XIG4_OREAU